MIVAYPPLKEAAQGISSDLEADHAAAAVDLVDRVGRDEPPAPCEPLAHRERVWNLGLAAVHRAFDAADESAVRVRDEIAGSLQEL